MERIAFVHLIRTGGTSLNKLFLKAHGPELAMISWHQKLERDWTAKEMKRLAANDRIVYVHNHAVNWTANDVEIFKQSGWTLLTLTRDVGEQLCSIYFYFPRLRSVISLDEFIQEQLWGRSLEGLDYRHWSLPADSDIEQIEFTPQKAANIVARTGKPIGPLEEKENASANPGFKCLRTAGRISDETIQLLDNYNSGWRSFPKWY